MFTTYLLKNIGLQIKAILVSNFYSTDVKSINQRLYRLCGISRGCSECEKTKMWVLGHHKSNDLVVRVFSCRMMGLVYQNKLANIDAD